MTNSERLRSMSDEDLAEFLGSKFKICDITGNQICYDNYFATCKECAIRWLREENK